MQEIFNIQELNNLINDITKKIKNIIYEVDINFPFSRDITTGKLNGTDYCDWSGGHWVGLLLRCYEWSQEEVFLEEAKDKLSLIEKRITDEDEFLGFIFYYSFAYLSDMLKSQEYKKLALNAADKLLRMQNNKIGLIPLGSQCKILGTDIKGNDIAGVDDAIIPNILLFWAYARTGNKRYLNVAIQNLEKSIQLFMREDGSTVHMIRFNPETGKVMQKWNNLGYDSSTTWSRGHVFLLLALAYGFKYTRNSMYKDFYTKALYFYLSVNKDKDLTPYYDMTDPNIPNVPKDTSALTILAESYILMTENGYSEFNLLAKIFNSMIAHIDMNKNSPTILNGGCFDYPRNIAINSELIFSDYYCYDFLLRLFDYLKVIGNA